MTSKQQRHTNPKQDNKDPRINIRANEPSSATEMNALNTTRSGGVVKAPDRLNV